MVSDYMQRLYGSDGLCPNPARQGEIVFHCWSCSVAQAGVLSLWQVLQAFGTPMLSRFGQMNAKVC